MVQKTYTGNSSRQKKAFEKNIPVQQRSGLKFSPDAV